MISAVAAPTCSDKDRSFTRGAMDHQVDPTNAAQEQAWDSTEGSLWAVHADLLEQVPARYDAALLDAARIAPDDRVLDIGCGTGSLTRAAGRRATAGTALGVDLSAAMVEVARARAADLPNVAFLRADAQVHPFPAAGFDAVVSRTGASFFGDAPAAFANLARATAPGGRLALVTWQAPARNEWFVEVTTALAGRPLGPPPGVPGPFALADPDTVRALLGGAGYADVRVADVQERASFGRDPVVARDVMAELLGWLLDGRDAAEAHAALLETMRAHEGPDGVTFGSAAWLVTATRG
jgi:SAM-dependent methyltransferase